jgi:predicted RNase H-like nuclease (RuvC/YqgF family)
MIGRMIIEDNKQYHYSCRPLHEKIAKLEADNKSLEQINDYVERENQRLRMQVESAWFESYFRANPAASHTEAVAHWKQSNAKQALEKEDGCVD